MKHTLEELLNIVYQYYPRELGTDDTLQDRRRDQTEEHARLVAARRRAAEDPRWRALQHRISERFPEVSLVNYSLHLPSGEHDGCYSFTVLLPNATAGRALWFHISFLAPYYVTHGWSLVETVKKQTVFSVVYRNVFFILERDAIGPGLVLNPEELLSRNVTIKRAEVSFELLADELPYAQWIAREIEATFGCEPMPQEIGTVLVPEVSLSQRAPEATRFYDCFFSDRQEWVISSLSEASQPGMRIDTKLLTSPSLAVLTVLAAFFHILWPLTSRRGALAVETDGTLHREDALKMIAWVRPFVESSTDLRAQAAAQEFEALVAAWEEEDAPPETMVAWASSLLDEWGTSDPRVSPSW
ncbi:MAG: hypothetical protein ABI193_08890 [Minicystis sp.]